MRKSTLFLCFLALNLVLLGLACGHALVGQQTARPILTAKTELVRSLSLTDLCLFTEARYTRHPSMADLHTAFQDYPLSLEHYPTGSLVLPPEHLKGRF